MSEEAAKIIQAAMNGKPADAAEIVGAMLQAQAKDLVGERQAELEVTAFNPEPAVVPEVSGDEGGDVENGEGGGE